MNSILEEKIREQLTQFLPDAIARALTDYQRFSEKEAHDTPKGFSDHHKACQVALGHAMLLLDVADKFKLPDSKVGDSNAQIMLAALMQEAKGELAGFEGKSRPI